MFISPLYFSFLISHLSFCVRHSIFEIHIYSLSSSKNCLNSILLDVFRTGDYDLNLQQLCCSQLSCNVHFSILSPVTPRMHPTIVHYTTYLKLLIFAYIACSICHCIHCIQIFFIVPSAMASFYFAKFHCLISSLNFIAQLGTIGESKAGNGE